jgi:nicotinate-nucleotide adenylyltransferase
LPRPALSFGAISVATPPAPPGARIGVMGGSFNPPHRGHRLAAEAALRRLRLEAVWWIVTPGNPLKSHGALQPLAQRLAAVRAMARHPRMKVTALEAQLGSPYTSVTLAFLARRHPDVAFVWVMGADNLASFHRWQDWRGIAATMPIAVVDRPGWRLKALSSPAAHALERARIPESQAATLARLKAPAWVFLTTRLMPQSSTEIRRQLSDS